MSLASNIRIHRKQAGLTQIELADKLGVSIATLRRWEAGETAPTGTRIMEIAALLGISPDGLISDSEGLREKAQESSFPLRIKVMNCFRGSSIT